MNRLNFAAGLAATVLIPLVSTPGWTQVAADGTLSTTVTSTDQRHFTIEGGDRAGTNLFHSFREFSIPTGGSAVFNNATEVETIFSRVTGGNISTIDGLIRANGTANLFLLNPAGILFGPNASLAIGGSFVGTTADRIRFADGVEFAVEATTPLLTLSAPVGLQLGANAGSIQVQGTPAPNFLVRPPQVFQAQTVTLVGSDIRLSDASLVNPDGRLQLWAVRDAALGIRENGRVRLTSPAIDADWGLISLQGASLLDTSGADGGAITVRGRGLRLQDGSSISSVTSAFGTGEGITIRTTEFVDLLGASSPEQTQNPGLYTGVSGSQAHAGDITVETERLRLTNGSWIQSSILPLFDPVTFQLDFINGASSGDIWVQATEVEVRGETPFRNPLFPPDVPLDTPGVILPTAITTLVTIGRQNTSGTITVDADRVRILAGGRISTDLIGLTLLGVPATSGQAGDITIRADEVLEVEGITRGRMTGAVITSIQPSAEGQGGTITIDAGRLILSNGGTISSGLGGTGQAGSITIRAEDIQVSDPLFDITSQSFSGITVAVAETATGTGGDITLSADRLRVFNGGQITSSSQGQGNAGNINLRVGQLAVQGTSAPLSNGQVLPSAIAAYSTTASDAGSVTITADDLQVRDRGQITVSNSGTGNAGNLRMNADRILLTDEGLLQADVSSGNQGNLFLTASETLVLRNGGQITANARGESTGGNISITSPFIVAVADENSDITANAENSFGGRVAIDTTGVFGIQFREQLTAQSDITATSALGNEFSGTVEISNPDVDPGSNVIELPEGVVDASQQIATGCAEYTDSQFIATGRGGLPLNPTEQAGSDRPWSDVRDLSRFLEQPPAEAAPDTPPAEAVSPEPITEINSWVVNEQGQVELVAVASGHAPVANYATCSPVN